MLPLLELRDAEGAQDERGKHKDEDRDESTPAVMPTEMPKPAKASASKT